MANEYEPYENLANAIVVLAAKDYRVALRKRKRHPGSHEAQYRVSKLEGFFRSEWYGILTDVDGEYLMERIRKAGELEDRAVEDLPGVRRGVFLPAPVWSGTEILQPCLCKQRTLEGGRCKWKNR